jgi:hypothetical protein
MKKAYIDILKAIEKREGSGALLIPISKWSYCRKSEEGRRQPLRRVPTISANLSVFFV